MPLFFNLSNKNPKNCTIFKSKTIFKFIKIKMGKWQFKKKKTYKIANKLKWVFANKLNISK